MQNSKTSEMKLHTDSLPSSLVSLLWHYCSSIETNNLVLCLFWYLNKVVLYYKKNKAMNECWILLHAFLHLLGWLNASPSICASDNRHSTHRFWVQLFFSDSTYNQDHTVFLWLISHGTGRDLHAHLHCHKQQGLLLKVE